MPTTTCTHSAPVFWIPNPESRCYNSRFMLKITLLSFVCAAMLSAQDSDGKIRVIAFGAHPDDCDIRAGGTAAKFAALGHHVKFVAVTNGDAGHQSEGGGALAKRRRAEAIEAGRRIGVTYE